MTWTLGMAMDAMERLVTEQKAEIARLRAALQELRGVAFHNQVLHRSFVIDFIDAALKEPTP